MKHKILYIQYTNPACYPPLEHSSRILADNGWKALFLGTWDFTGRVLHFPPHPNITVRRISFCPGGWFQKLHYLLFCLWIFCQTLMWKPIWIYASDPLSCPVGLLLSYIRSLKVIYHEHDSPSSMSSMTYFMRLILWARGRLSRRANLCILPNEQRAKLFEKEMGNLKKILPVYNCPLKEEISITRKEYSRNGLWVIYYGSIGPSRLPLTVLKALTKMPGEIKLKIIGYETIGHTGYIKQLQKLASQLEISNRVEFIGTLPTRRELLKHCRDCDIGLAFMPYGSEDVNEQTMAGASNKPFDYLACGLALLVSDLPDWRKMYVEPGYGLTCNPEDPESIATGLRWFLEHPTEMRRMGELGRQRIVTEWNYEKQFEPVLKILSER